jgi:hypothetical protein
MRREDFYGILGARLLGIHLVWWLHRLFFGLLDMLKLSKYFWGYQFVIEIVLRCIRTPDESDPIHVSRLPLVCLPMRA